MPQSTNLNTPPYYEDFDVNDNFHKVLFRPGFPLQARELTTLQSILQDQVEKFGSSIYKDGAMVIPGQIGYDLAYNAILVEDEYFGIDSGLLVANQVNNVPVIVGKVIKGNTSGVRARVVNAISSEASEKGKTTLYIKYINSGSTDETTETQYTTFLDDEILITEQAFSVGTTVIQANTDFAKCITSQSTHVGSSAKITTGIYFVKGYFVTVKEQEIILDQFGTNPSYKVGLQVLEEIVTPEDDPTLNDQAQGYSNYSAPGAHRLKLQAVLVKKSLDDTTATDFIELLKIEDGVVKEIVSTSKAQIAKTLEDTLARRTYDESGDYEVNPYRFSFAECLDNGINNGVFNLGQKTSQDNTASNNLFEVVVSPGKAYVRGYEIETISNTYVDIEKPRTSESVQNKTISTNGAGVAFRLAGTTRISQTDLNSELTGDRIVTLKNSSSTTIGYAIFKSYTEGSTYNLVRLANISFTGTNTLTNIAKITVGSTNYDLVSSASKYVGSAKDHFFRVFGDAEIKNISDLKVQQVLTYAAGTTSGNSITISNREYFSTTSGDYTVRLAGEDASDLTFTVTGDPTTGTLTGTVSGRSGSGDAAFILVGPEKISVPTLTLSSHQKMRIVKLTDITDKYDVNDTLLPLGVTRVNKVHAVYTGATISDVIPQVTLVGATGTFEIGEVIEGAKSGAKARIIRQDGNTVNFVYVSTITFLDNEEIKGLTSGTTRNISTVDGNGGVNIKSRYRLRDGQTNHTFEYSSLEKVSSESALSGTVWVVFDYFEDVVDGQFYTINSYYDTTYDEIPYYDTDESRVYLSNVLDWRINQNNAVTGNGDYVDPFIIDATEIATNTTLLTYTNANYKFNQYLLPTGSTDGDIEYYLGRIDDLYLDKNGNFVNKKGIPSLLSSKPDESLANAMKVGTITMPPYVRDLSKVTFERSTNKRYTMRDIGLLEKRITNIEYYTQLSLLESDTANLLITDSNGNTRLKNGFLVDNFTSHNIGEPSHPNYKCSISGTHGELRPQHYTTNSSLAYKTVPSNYIKGDLIMLDYTDQLIIEQPYAAVSENVNPFAVVSWVGLMQIFPASDDWIDENRLPDTVTEVEGDYAATLYAMDVDPNTGFAPTEWGAWETQWTGSRTSSSTQNYRRDQHPYVRQVTTTTTTTTTAQTRSGVRSSVTPTYDTVVLGDRVVDTKYARWKRSRNIASTAFRLKPNVRVYPFLEGKSVEAYTTPKIIGIQMTSGSSAFQAGEDIALSGTISGRKFRATLSTPKAGIARLDKPYEVDPYTGNAITATAYTASSTFLNINIESMNELDGSPYGGYLLEGDKILGLTSGATATVTKKRLIADEKGNLRVSVYIPDPNIEGNPRWAVGDSVLKLTDSKENSVIPGVVDSSAEGVYSARGTILSKQTDTLLVRNAEITQDTVTDNRIVTSSSSSTRDSGWYDPLAQSFLIENAGGCFISKIDVYFRTKDDNLPVTMQIREMVNGYPSPTVLATINKDPSDVSVSDDATASTTFVFTTPVYLAERKEYCFVLLTASVEYNVWLSEMGKDDLSGERISKQPYAGVLFKSQNASTWTTAEYQDMKFKIYRCKFKINEKPQINFVNDNSGNLFFKKLRPDPVELTINYTNTSTGNGFMKVHHANHNMYDNASFVEIKGVSTEIYADLYSNWNGQVGAGGTTGGIPNNAIRLKGNRDLFHEDSTELAYDQTVSPTRNGILGAAPSASNPGYLKIGDYIYSYDPSAVSAVDGTTGMYYIQLIDKITTASVPSGGFKSADKWKVELYVKNGIPLTKINTTHSSLKYITLDSYQIDLGGLRRNLDDLNTTFGGENATASTNLQYNYIEPMVSYKELPGTELVAEIKTTSATSLGDSSHSDPTTSTSLASTNRSYLKDGSYREVNLNANNWFTTPKLIASSINEDRQMSEAKSFELRFTLSSTADNLSPVIDTDRISVITTANRICDFDGTFDDEYFFNDNGTYNIGQSAKYDFNAANYITKYITLANECTSLKILTTAFNSANTDIDVYVKLLTGDESNPNDIAWEELTANDYAGTKSEEEYKEYSYLKELTGDDTFTKYAVKIRLRSRNTSETPVLQDLRCIALA